MNRRRFLQHAVTAAAAQARGADKEEPLRLWYRQPAPDWNEALPVGNGRLGAMIFGGVAAEHLQLNEDTLYSDEPGCQDVPIDIRKNFEEVLTLLRSRKFREAEAIMNQTWIGRVWPCYQPLGDLWLDFGHAGADEYNRELDLREGVSRVSYRAGGVRYTREVLASFPDQVIVIHLTADRAGALQFTARFESVHPTVRVQADGAHLVMTGKAPGLAVRRTLEWIEQRGDQWKYPELWEKDGRRKPSAKPVLYGDEIGGLGMAFEARLVVTGATPKQTSAGLRVEGASEVTLFLSMATSYNRFNKSPSRDGADPSSRTRADLRQAGRKTFASIRTAHVADYRSLFDRVEMRLGEPGSQSALPTDERIARFGNDQDPQLASLYFQFARYLMIAGSRPGTQPLNLQGIWNREVIPPWASGYTININTEMNYWPVEVANLSECAEPLTRMIRELAVSGREVARHMYGRRGWVAHHNTTIWRCAQPVDNAAQPAFWPMSSGWLCRHLWEHFEFTQDRRFLETEAYPLMKEAAEFYLDWVVEDAKGRLVTPAGISPEIGFLYRDTEGKQQKAAVSMGPTMDLAIIRDLFGNCLQAAELLERDAGFRDQLKSALSRLLPLQVGSRGQLQEWAEDFLEQDTHHRHISHLYALHPGKEISRLGDPKLMAAATKALELRGDAGTGWSRAWKISFWARLGDGNHAYRLVRNLFHPAKSGQVRYSRGGVMPNLFCSHPPFQIDGNFGGAAGIAEMLLQSHLGEVHLLPALPDAWPSGFVRGLRARGGLEVDIEWSNGRLSGAVLRSKTGGTAVLRYEDKTARLEVPAGRSVRLGPVLKL